LLLFFNYINLGQFPTASLT